MYDAGVANWRLQPQTVIEEARLASGLGQAELAALSGTSQPTLSAYERGKKTPDAANSGGVPNSAKKGNVCFCDGHAEFVQRRYCHAKSHAAPDPNDPAVKGGAEILILN